MCSDCVVMLYTHICIHTYIHTYIVPYLIVSDPIVSYPIAA